MSITVTLKSSTVFWTKDLGVTPAQMDRLRAEERTAQKVVDAVTEWLEREAKGTYRLHADGVWFMDERDAVLFKLFWAGNVWENSFA